MKRIIAISICVVFVLSASMVPLAQEKKEKSMTFEEFKVKVKEKIEERNAKLLDHFNKRAYDKMPGEFTLHSRIVTHEGEVIQGKDSENYWRKVGRKLKGFNLKFEKEYLEFKQLTVSEPPENWEINYVAYEITKFSFVGGSSGAIDTVYRHRVICEID